MAERPMTNNRFALPFAAWELRLYLDTHPDDERALAAYKKLCATIGGCSYPCVTPQGMMAAGTDSSSSCPWDPAANHVESED